jgi:hypothetical protein
LQHTSSCSTSTERPSDSAAAAKSPRVQVSQLRPPGIGSRGVIASPQGKVRCGGGTAASQRVPLPPARPSRTRPLFHKKSGSRRESCDVAFSALLVRWWGRRYGRPHQGRRLDAANRSDRILRRPDAFVRPHRRNGEPVRGAVSTKWPRKCTERDASASPRRRECRTLERSTEGLAVQLRLGLRRQRAALCGVGDTQPLVLERRAIGAVQVLLFAQYLRSQGRTPQSWGGELRTPAA